MSTPPKRRPGGSGTVSAEQFERLQRQVVEMGLAVKESAQVNTLERYLDGLVGSLGEYLSPLRDIMPRPDPIDDASRCALEDIKRWLAAPRWADIVSADLDIGIEEPPVIGAPRRDGTCRPDRPGDGKGYQPGRTAQ